MEMTTTITMMAIIATSLISLSCVACAALMLWHQRKGWGWFLVIAFLASGMVVAVVPDDGPAKPITKQVGHL
jgi:hypothetical protein